MPTPVLLRSRRPSRRSDLVHLVVAGALAAFLVVPASAAAQLRREAPKALTDAEFWNFFTSMSEAGGSFPSENFVSNEMTFQNVIPTLQKSLTPDGVYMGVGPEQNFTYIANLKPRMAVIVDIRRQNAMQHLMYKALFELAPTRTEFVSKLFSRPMTTRFGSSVKPAELFDSVTAVAANDSAFTANWDAITTTLKTKHHFALSESDIATIRHVYTVFFEAGPGVNYGYRLGNNPYTRSMYPTYGMLQGATNVDSLPMAYLATEENYRTIRDMEMKNLIIPVVGSFAGPTAIRAVGQFLRQRSLTVTAFYLSNVEQYLYQNGVARQFYDNVSTLPMDSTSTFIRSVPPQGGGNGFTFVNRAGISGGPGTIYSFGPGTIVFGGGGGGGGAFSGSVTGNYISMNGSGTSSMSIIDSGGVRIIRTTQDSAGKTITRIDTMRTPTAMVRIDSGRIVPFTQPDSLLRQRILSVDSARMRAIVPVAPGPPVPRVPVTPTVMTSLLVSGLAPIRTTLDDVAAGKILNYGDLIAATKLSGWK